jgi:hypothetical protein
MKSSVDSDQSNGDGQLDSVMPATLTEGTTAPSRDGTHETLRIPMSHLDSERGNGRQSFSAGYHRRSVIAEAMSSMGVMPMSPTAAKVKTVTCQKRLRGIVSTSVFDYGVGIAVLLNALLIGAQVDWSARNISEATPAAYKVINWIFCILFTLELIIRMMAFGIPNFFRNSDWKWNVFDTIIVCCQLLEELTSTIVDSIFGSDLGSEYTNFTLVRVLRVLRLVRIMRFMRILRLIRELHTMVGSIIGSLRSFLWTVALLFGLIYVVGVYITQIVADHMRSDPEGDFHGDGLRRYYGSLGNSILSLFQALSGGVDWEDLLTPLYLVTDWKVGITLFYTLYIAFATFVMLNLVTGIFVDSAQTNIREDRDVELVNRVHELFIKADDDHSGKITWQEFKNQLDTPQMAEYFKTLDLDTSEAEYLYKLLDVHGNECVTSEEFVNGCLRLRGPAKAYDVAAFIKWNKRLTKRMLDGIIKLENISAHLAEAQGLNHSIIVHDPATPTATRAHRSIRTGEGLSAYRASTIAPSTLAPP